MDSPLIRRATFARLWFRDRLGVKRYVAGLSLHGRRQFQALLAIAEEIYNTEFPGLNIATAYERSEDFADACDLCLWLFGIHPDWVTIPQLHGLLFQYREQDSQVQGAGLLVQLEFPPPDPSDRDPDAKPLPANENWYTATIASVWLAQPNLGLGEVIALAGNRDAATYGVSWEDLQQILRSRARMVREADPKWQKEEKERQAERRTVELLRQVAEGERKTQVIENPKQTRSKAPPWKRQPSK